MTGNPSESMPADSAVLKRTLGLPLITFYGLGTILGAGIYVLVGKVAGPAGMYAPMSFLVAAVVAAFTAFSYAELSSRFPVSAGEAVYIQHGLGLRWLSVIVGLLIVLSGLVSSAAIANGFVGYLNVFIELPPTVVIASVVLSLGLLAAWGIAQSATVAAIATLIEVAGLVLVVTVSWESLQSLPLRLPELVPQFETGAWRGIMLGAFLAFYAFIGFEDMVNVAEEVKHPERNMPRAIILALVASTLLYLLVAMAAVLAVPRDELINSGAPLALVFERGTGTAPTAISLISLFAVVNGALIQIIMAARVLYGMGRQRWLPQLLARIHPRTQTPVVATALVTAAVLLFALLLPLVTLARVTSFVVLVVFVLVNLALIRIKRRHPAAPGARVYPGWIPYGGIALASMLIVVQIMEIMW